MGARPMQRIIQDKVRKALADELLFGKLVGGGRVDIDIADDDETVSLTFISAEPVGAKRPPEQPLEETEEVST